MQEQKYMPSAMAANTKPEPDICMCKAWGKGGVDPANGESGKGVNEGRRAADAFEKRAHIPTVCRQSLPGRPQCTDRRSGRPLPPKPSGPMNMRPARDAGPNPRVPCRARGATKPYGISMDKARTHAPPRRPGSGPRSAGSRRYLIPVIRAERWKDELLTVMC